MLSTSDIFTQRATGQIRPLSWGCSISFDKTFNDDIDFFTIGTSTIAGGDFIKPADSEVVQEWDKYVYTDYSSRIIDISIEQKVLRPYSITMAMADIVLDNHDDFFTPGKGSSIDGYILPYRPIRLYLGFGTEVIPKFIGITRKMPVIDEKKKTATFHCIDFMYSLMERPLNESALILDSRTDEIMEQLFILAGLEAVQLNLDEGLTTIPYAYFNKDDKLGVALNKLIEVEMGKMYMDELGIINFKNRVNPSMENVMRFNAYANILSSETRKDDELINVVEVKGKTREVQPNYKYWELADPVQVKAGESVDIWASFNEPVTGVDTPVYATSATTSLFTVNTAQDGSGTADAVNVTLTSSSLFAKSYKMTFTNGGGSDLWITTLDLFATPVKVVNDIYIREQDDASVATYDERILTIDNDFIQNEDDARSLALSVLANYSDFNSFNKLEVKGTPALQIDDPVEINVFDVIGDYKITKMTDRMSYPGRYTQLLEVKKDIGYSFFTIGSSTIGGPDVIAP